MAEKLGAKLKITAEVSEKVCSLVAAGNPLKFAAESSGLCESTVMKWLRLGRQGKTPEAVKFFHDIKKAQADSVSVRVKRITKAGRTTWQANAWWLERMHPDHFGTDKRLVAQLIEQVTTLRAQLEAADADARGDRGRRKAARKKNRKAPTAKDGSHI